MNHLPARPQTTIWQPVRGFAPYKPQAKTRILLETVNAILIEYEEVLPLTGRQIFYILVAKHAYPKTEGDYTLLLEKIARARRARMIDMDKIRTDKFIVEEPFFYRDIKDFFEYMTDLAGGFRLDRQRGQARRLVIWCEAAGMVQQLARIASPFGIPVYSSGGFDSLTMKHAKAKEWAETCIPHDVLHVGDLDPSGVANSNALGEDLEAFGEEYGGEITVTRIAITEAQARKYNLPSAPPKPSDRRRFEGGETWQVEALDPAVLADIVRTEIAARIDDDIYQAVLAEEAELREQLRARLDVG